MESIVVRCECGKAYKVGADQAGKRFRCKECGAALTVEVEEAVEVEEERPRARAGASRRTARTSDAGASRRSGGASRTRGRAAGPKGKKSLVPLIAIGAGAVVVIVVLVIALSSGGKKDPPETNDNVAQKPPETTKPVEPTPEQKARQEFSRLARRARETEASADFEAAVSFGTEKGDFIAKAAVMDLCKLWVQKEPKAEKPNELLGNSWVEKADRFMNPTELAAWQEQEKKRKDPFHRACRQIIENVLTDNVGEEQTKFDYYYDIEDVPRPYLLAVENDGITSTDIVAKEVGKKSLAILYDKFKEEYSELLQLSDIEKPVPVYVFMGKKGYEKWRNDGRRSLPSSNFVGGFYSPSWDGRGLLHVWRFTEKNPMGVYFHEGTHQLMDYYDTVFGSRAGKTPWFQEGIAEFFGGVQVVVREGKLEVLIGQPNSDRMGEVRRWASSDRAARMALKDIVAIDYDKFSEAMYGDRNTPEAQKIRSACYAMGWVLVDFCFNSLDDQWREGMRGYMKKELTGSGGGAELAKSLGVESDEDWEFLEDELAEYIIGDLSKRWRDR